MATIIPIANDGTNPKVQAYNAALPGRVNVRAIAGKHVVLLDNYAAFSQDPSCRTTLMGDYLHPNDAGYFVLGRAMYRAISALLGRTRLGSCAHSVGREQFERSGPRARSATFGR